MTKPEWRMTNKAGKCWARWLLAIWEGALFGWFMFACWFEIGLMLRVANSVNTRSEPPLTELIRVLRPEGGWLFLLGLFAHSLGFGLLSLHSKEPPTSRIYRYVIVLAVTSLIAASVPILDTLLILNGGPDNIWGGDEFLFLGSGLILSFYGFVKERNGS